jgi:hypothetical protein
MLKKIQNHNKTQKTTRSPLSFSNAISSSKQPTHSVFLSPISSPHRSKRNNKNDSRRWLLDEFIMLVQLSPHLIKGVGLQLFLCMFKADYLGLCCYVPFYTMLVFCFSGSGWDLPFVSVWILYSMITLSISYLFSIHKLSTFHSKKRVTEQQ